MLALMLIDVADPRYGGSPDPDDERRRRWRPMDKRITVPFLGSASCLIVSAVTSPEASFGLTFAAVGLCAYAARVALATRDQDRGRDEPTDPPE